MAEPSSEVSHPTVLVGPFTGDEPAELALAHALLRRASSGALPEALHLYAPVAPAVVFGRRDTRLPGFAAAVTAAERAGFTTGVRAVGGRVVAYTPRSLVLNVVRHEPHAALALDRRFEGYGERMVAALRALGIDARMGAVPGEYCPGAHSVNARGSVKLVGTAQRVVKGAWLFSLLLPVDDQAPLKDVLTEVHGHLGLPLDPGSVGTVRAEAPGVTLEDVQVAVAGAWGLAGADRAVPDDATLALAAALVGEHRTRA